MTTPSLAPRSPRLALSVVWSASAVIALAVGFFAPDGDRGTWYAIGLGACTLLAFFMQVLDGRAAGFIFRVSASVVGAALILGVISGVFGLASLAFL